MLVEPEVTLTLTEGEVPWDVREANNEDCELARLSAEKGEEQARSDFRRSKDRVGTFASCQRERVLTVKLTDTCEHAADNFEQKKCGHAFC